MYVKKPISIKECPDCKSGYTVRYGFNTTKTGVWRRRKCQECGRTFYENKNKNGGTK